MNFPIYLQIASYFDASKTETRNHLALLFLNVYQLTHPDVT